MKCLAIFVLLGFVNTNNIFHVNLTKFYINEQENEANLEWSNGIKKTIDLKKDSISDDCIYNSQIGDEEKIGEVLVTGCKDEIKHIQIHSEIYGDTLATIDSNGNIELFSEPLTDEITDADQIMDFSDNGNSEPNDNNIELPEVLTIDLNLYESSCWIKGR